MGVTYNVFTGQFDFTGSGSGGGGVSGSGTPTQIAYWDSSSSVTSDAGFSLDIPNQSLNLGSGTDVVKQTTLTSNVLAAGSYTDSLLFTTPVADKFAVIEYSVERGAGNLRVGTLLVSNDGSGVKVTDYYSELGSTGILLDSSFVNHTISGSDVEIRVTSTGGVLGTFKKLIRRWS